LTFEHPREFVPEVQVFPDPVELASAGADRVVRACREALAARGEFAVALSGGETPRLLYERLAEEPRRSRIPWDRVRIFWGDERGVPPDDPRSNFRMAQETLLAHVPVAPERVHRMPAEGPDPRQAALEYAGVLMRYLPLGPDGWPKLDLVLLGLGEDGHTASLFPGTPVLREAKQAVVAYRIPGQDVDRMTLTAPVLNRAREIIFLVSGERKARALQEVLAGPRRPEAAPAQLIQPQSDGRLVWLVDRPAASLLLSRAARIGERRLGEDAG
jgi:6-phosphogluconolactonase